MPTGKAGLRSRTNGDLQTSCKLISDPGWQIFLIFIFIYANYECDLIWAQMLK